MSLDWALYRELFAPTDESVWGRFPHFPMGELSNRLGVPSNSIWRKLREWGRTGFHRGYLVLPHPSLMGVGLAGFCLRVSGPSEKQKLLADLELIDGVIFSAHYVGSRVDVIVVADRDEAQKRRRELISRLEGVSFVGSAKKVWLPRCEGSLFPTDWRILTALRKSPDESVSGLAKRTGLSVRTVTRRLHRFRLSHAVLSHFVEDWTQFPGTVAGLQVEVNAAHDPETVAKRLAQEIPSCLATPSWFHPPGEPSNALGFLLPIRTGPAIDDIVGKALGIPGVAKVDSFFPGGERSYPGWIDEHIELFSQQRS